MTQYTDVEYKVRRENSQTRGVGGTDTGATVLDGPVCAGELAQVVADHLRLDLNRVEDLQPHRCFNGMPLQEPSADGV